MRLPAPLALSLLLGLGLAGAGAAEAPPAPSADLIAAPLKSDVEAIRALREHYTKYEYRVPMRDGAHLFTNVYVPKDRSRRYGILLTRTPYSVAPYGIDNFPSEQNPRALAYFAAPLQLIRAGLIFAQQDVRGRMMSEGEFVDVRPVNPRKGPRDIDETTDSWDTIDFLVKNVPGNNGRVGVWGNSYPGFYAAQTAIDAHPALKAVSPQAPVTEWFLGDDFHHNGAFCLADAFLFFADFGRARPQPVAKWRWDFDPDMGDLYDFFLKLGPLRNGNERYFKGSIAFWNDLMRHPNRDAWWQARDPRPHLRRVRPAVLTVGGLYDAEDLYGALGTYHAIESQSPGADNGIVLGPWRHGGWFRTDGDTLGDASFAQKTGVHFRERIIAPFFLQHLRGDRPAKLPDATIFETGTNEWRAYDQWPPRGARSVTLHLREGGRLAVAPPERDGADSYPSDPAHPVPYSAQPARTRVAEFMTEDQRFAARRPDVLSYETPPLTGDVTLAGPIEADLWVSTTGGDADFVVKVIDVFPDSAADPEPNPRGIRLGGYQQLVRGEIMRGRFRNSFERPEAFVPGQPARVRFTLPDVNHTFRGGHRLMVQVQSSWFPLFDRNPQTFVDPYTAKESDFRPATHTIHRSPERRSMVRVTLLRGAL